MKTLLVSLLLGLAFQGLRVQSQDLEAVHEWGTFTTFSGSNGVPLAWWTPALEGPAALPEFVQPVAMKAGSPYVTRMETPVLYFYAKQPMEATVQVQYHQGILTDIFPLGHPWYAPTANLPATSSTYSWTVDLLPPSSPEISRLPAVGKRGAHYAHARDVPDAWLVSSKAGAAEGHGEKNGIEKFIFYRGAGIVPFPLTSSSNEDGVVIVNTSS